MYLEWIAAGDEGTQESSCSHLKRKKKRWFQSTYVVSYLEN